MADFIFKASIFSICAGKGKTKFQFCGKPLFSTHNTPEDKDDGEYIVAKEIKHIAQIQSAYLIDKNTIFFTDKKDVASLLLNNPNSIFWIVITDNVNDESHSDNMNKIQAPIKIERAWIVNG